MANEPTPAERPPVVIDGNTGDVLPQGNDLKSSQIKSIAQEVASRVSDEDKLAFQRNALNTGFNEVRDRAVKARENNWQPTDSAQTTAMEAPKKPWYSFLKFW